MILADLIGEALAQAEALTAAARRAVLPGGPLPGEEAPPRAVWGGRFGDCSTACPLAIAGSLGRPPREVAALLAAQMALRDTFFASVETGGPGFLNFRLSRRWYQAVLEAAEAGAPRQTPPAALSDQEALRLLLAARPGVPVDPDLPLRRDRGNPLYRLRYAVQRLRRLPEPGGAVKDIPFSPAEQELIKAIAACPPALCRAEAEGDLRPAARCLLSLTDALRACHTASRLAGTPLHPRPLRAARRTLEDGMRVLGIAIK